MASWRCPHFKGLGDSGYLDVTFPETNIAPESQFLEDNVSSWENQLIGNHFCSLCSEAMLVSGIVSSLVFSFANHCGESKPKEVRGYLWQVTSLFIYIYLPFAIYYHFFLQGLPDIYT